MIARRLIGLLLLAGAAASADWPRFRGADAAGTAADAPTPFEMSPESGYEWKRDVPLGKSSPVLSGPRLFLTAHDGDRLLTMAFDRATGKTLWTRAVERRQTDERNETNDAAAPTPVVDGRSVYSFFADFGLVAYSVEGEEIWRTPLGPFTSPHGVASSPLLIDGVLVLMLEQLRGGEIIGVDAETGEKLWSAPRPTSMGGSFATPLAYRTPSGENQAVVMSPFELAAYDARTGEKLWRIGGLPHQPKSSPVLAGEVILAGVQGDRARGNLKSWEEMLADLDKNGDGRVLGEEIRGSIADYDHDGDFDRSDYDQWFVEKSPPSRLMAVRPGDGSRDITRQATLWTVDRGVPRVTTPLAYDGVVYLMRNGGILTALDLETGSVLKEGRLRDAIDEYFASPVAASGKVLTINRGCVYSWIEAGPEWEVAATGDLGEECFATPALAEDGVYIRTQDALYRFKD